MSDNGDTPSPRSSSEPASSQSPPPAPPSVTEPSSQSPKKRGSVTAAEGKVTKRRAARACVSCRARKVRCDVVEGAPCGNCRWDDVECIVQESRRRKKNLQFNCGPAAVGTRAGSAEALRAKSLGALPPIITANLAKPPFAPDGTYALPLNGRLLYQQSAGGFGAADPGSAAALGDFSPATPAALPSALHHHQPPPFLTNPFEQPAAAVEWPAFIKPVPDRILADDRHYLTQKRVFALPPLRLQNALLAAYVEYVHPYMPLMELHDFLRVVNDRTGASGRVSLFLYHAVMFAATAFVDEALLKDAGYESRRDARRAFFSRTRLLYDFDYETDRLILVQGLLLMTYWYETPDDQKDTWHWMGVAISLAHTIGLHRDPAKTPMIPRKQKLWKRVWWSCLMRDRLVALGMRRPTRIKSEDFDVPPLDEADFEIEALPDDNQLLAPECALMRDVAMQRELAVMCIEKAKLCLLIGEMLKVQYSVLSVSGVRPENTVNSTHMLLPNKNPDNMAEVERVDKDLAAWFAGLPDCCRYTPLDASSLTYGNKVVGVQRNLLHMVYHTTISALHRPLFLPASPTEGPSTPVEVQETARQRVREAAEHITGMAAELRRRGLERYLPTTGVTVILPAMIVHMLDTKSAVPETRAKAALGLRECLVVMSNLRNIYAAADFATGFLDALLRKGMLGNHPAAAAGSPRLPQQRQRQHSHLAAAARQGKMLNRVLAPALNLAPQQQQQQQQQSLPLLDGGRPSTPPPDGTAAGGFLNPTNIPWHTAAGTASASAAENFLSPSADGLGAHSATTPPPTDSEDAPSEREFTSFQQQNHRDRDVSMAEQMMVFGYPATAGATTTTTTTGGNNLVDGGDGAALFGTAVGAAGTGNNFDFDQWLEFPTEAGLSGSDDTFMGGMFAAGAGGGEAVVGLDGVVGSGGEMMDWMGNLPEGISH